MDGEERGAFRAINVKKKKDGSKEMGHSGVPDTSRAKARMKHGSK